MAEVDNNIHRVNHKLENALRRLKENPRLLEKAKAAVRRFVEDLASQGISEYRQLWYLTHLVPFAEGLADRFSNPSKGDVKEVMAKVEGSKLSTWSKVNKRTAVKRFYKWLLGDDEEYPECVRWIHTTRGREKRRLPEDLLTREEVQGLLEGAVNPRDRALIALLADGGLRIGEALSVRVKDFEADRYGGVLMVPAGKTGARRVRLIESVPHLAAWRKVHPHREDPDAPLFCYLTAQEEGKGEKRRLRGHDRGQAMSYPASRKAIRQAAIRAGVPVAKVKPHNFRHTRATVLAKTVPEAPLEAQMGWVPGSQMSKVYVHLSGRDVDEAILRSHGIEVEGEERARAKPLVECPRCDRLNEAEGRFCHACGMALSAEAAEEAESAPFDIQRVLRVAEEAARSTHEELVGDVERLKEELAKLKAKES